MAAKTPSKSGIPPKPTVESDFRKPVAWLLGRQLIASLKGVLLYVAFKGKLDTRDWMQTEVFPDEVVEPASEFWKVRDGEFWFDYIADTGDGQRATYSIGYLCMSNLWASRKPGEHPAIDSEVGFIRFFGDPSPSERTLPVADSEILLPRGEFLFVGGDTGYHIADYATLATRFQNPFTWAFRDLRTDERLSEADGAHVADEADLPDSARRPIFAIPGNHDYYDMIDGFQRQFRRPFNDEGDEVSGRPQLQIPGFRRYQTASYVGLKLPFDWWFWGLDVETERLDLRQKDFFRRISQGKTPEKLIIATPEPSTVLGKYTDEDSKISKALADLGLKRPFLRNAKAKGEELEAGTCRLDLSGDAHLYARYWGTDTRRFNDAELSSDNYASVVSGLGGAFHHPSYVNVGEVEEQELYPTREESRAEVARRIFNPTNIIKGGYIWLLGAIGSLVVFLGATVAVNTKPVVNKLPVWKALGVNLDRLRQTSGLFPGPMDSTANLEPYGYSMKFALFVVLAVAAIIGCVLYSDALAMRAKKRKAKVNPILLLAPIAVVGIGLAVGAWKLGEYPDELRPFGRSLGVLASLLVCLICTGAAIWYPKKLFEKAHKKEVKWYDYWPMWVLTTAAVAVLALGIWRFGTEPAFRVVSDLVFTFVVLTVVVGMIFLSYKVGGELLSVKGKLGFGALGVWHAVLQLASSFLLLKLGNWLTLVLALALILVFIPIGAKVARLESGVPLLVVSIVYGVLMLLLPIYVPAWMGMESTSSTMPAWLSVTLSSAIAAPLGSLLSCVWLGWYFAVSLGFNGHDSFGGGAARIERFKQFIRFKLTRDTLTGYVIAVDDPKINGSELKPRLIDVFELKV